MKALLINCLTGLCLGFVPLAQASFNAEQITQHVYKFLQTEHLATLQNSYPKGEFNVTVNRVDPRLRLAECSEALQLTLHGARKDYGYLTVRVRCSGSQPWTVYVSANVDITTQVIVATRPLQRGQIIDDTMITLKRLSLNGLGQHFYQRAEDIIGKQVAHSMSGNRVIRSNMLEEALLVKRGDNVVIIAQNEALAVKMTGTALSNGQKGEQIRVKNNRSQRIVKAEVLSRGEVAVLL